MGNKIEFDSFMKAYGKDNAELTSELAPDFGKIETGSVRAARGPALLGMPAFRVAAAVVAMFVLFTAGALYSGSGVARATRQRALNFIQSIVGGGTTAKSDGFAVLAEEPDIVAAQKKVPYHIPVPHWLPNNYAFDRIELIDNGNGLYRVVLYYASGGEKLVITYDNDSEGMAASQPQDDESYEEIDAQGMKVYLRDETGNEDNSHAIFATKEGLLVGVLAPMDKQAMLQLILGLY